MNTLMRQRTETVSHAYELDAKKQPLHRRFYLLERSLERYTYLQEHEAPDILVNVEMDLIQGLLLSVCTEMEKGDRNHR